MGAGTFDVDGNLSGEGMIIWKVSLHWRGNSLECRISREGGFEGWEPHRRDKLTSCTGRDLWRPVSATS